MLTDFMGIFAIYISSFIAIQFSDLLSEQFVNSAANSTIVEEMKTTQEAG